MHQRAVLAVLCLIFLCMAPSNGECQRVPKVTLFELNAENLTEDDLSLKRELEGILETSLRKAGINVIPVKRGDFDLVKNEDVFARYSKSDFYVTGTFKSMSGLLGVSVHLFRNGNGAYSEVLPLPEPRIPKEIAFQVLDSWFRNLSSRILSVVQGRRQRQTVYTHCFKIYGGEAEMQGLASSLALDLRGVLAEPSALGKRYEVLGFNDEGEVTLICAQSFPGSYLQLYDYVISGQIWPQSQDKVTIGLQISTGGQPRLKESLTRSKNQLRLVGELRNYIVTHWSRVDRR